MTSPPPPDFDLQALRTLRGDLPPKVFQLVRSGFLQEAQQQVALLSSTARRGDLVAPESGTGLLKAAHDLHTNARAFGCLGLSRLAAVVESHLRGRGQGAACALESALLLPEKLNYSEQWLFQDHDAVERSR